MISTFVFKISTVDDGDTDSTDSTEPGCCERTVVTIQLQVTACLKGNSRILRRAFLLICLLLYFAYLGYSLYYRFGDEGNQHV